MSNYFNKWLHATAEDIASWKKNNSEKFFCHFCGDDFALNNLYMIVYTNDTRAPGNPIICNDCWREGDPVEMWIEKWRQWKKICKDYRWFIDLERWENLLEKESKENL